MSPIEIYNGSNGAATKALYDKLYELGPAGEIALNLFRASKNSGRAKLYRGRGYKDAAYERKAYSMQELCKILAIHAAGTEDLLGMERRSGPGVPRPGSLRGHSHRAGFLPQRDALLPEGVRRRLGRIRKQRRQNHHLDNPTLEP